MDAIPPNAVPPWEKEVVLYTFEDSNHVHNKQTRRSSSEFMIYMNVINNWHTKKQSTTETLVFGARFVGMKVGVETLHAIQY